MMESRPVVLSGKTVEMQTGCGSLFVTINFHNGKPWEVFAYLGKAGGCSNAQNEALTRLLTIILKNGVSVEEVVKQLTSIRCLSANLVPDVGGLSCSDAIGKALGRYINGVSSEDSKV